MLDRTVLILCSFASPLLSQAEWRDVTVAPGERRSPAMCYDTLQTRTVLFGGFDPAALVQRGDTWTYGANTWLRLPTAAGPLLAGGPKTAYDSVRDRIVAHGSGWGGGGPQTWEFDGALWTQLSVVNPPPLFDHAMAFDAARGVTLLYGDGMTFEWDGLVWTQFTPTNSPGTLEGHHMAYHAGLQRVVLHGGSSGFFPSSTSHPELWEWNGVNWSLLDATGPARHGHGLAYDSVRDRLVVFGGRDFLTVESDTWEWDGAAWNATTPANAPGARTGFAMTFDQGIGRVLVFGGFNPSFPGAEYGDTWQWDGVDWSSAGAPPPPARTEAAFAYDSTRGRAVLYGGLDGLSSLGDTWELDGAGWTQVPTATQPTPDWGQPMTFDELRGVTVLCTNGQSPSVLASVWEYDGVDWTLRGGAPVSNQGALVYDSLRGRSLLYGGSTPADDVMRAWDGVAWTDDPASPTPGVRFDHGMAYDVHRDRVVVFGGRDAGLSALDDTWEFDGVAWQQVATSGPPARYASVMVYDALRDRVVLQGGRSGGTSYFDTWEWDGVAWQQTTASIPGIANGHSAVYDADDERIVVYRETALWDHATAERATAEFLGAGCAGSVGIPVLDVAQYGLPWIGDSLTVDITGIPADPTLMPFVFFGRKPAAIDLGAIGAPGCVLLVDTYLTEPRTNLSGTATWSAAVPFDPSLAGQNFYLQAISVDPAANPLGAAVSNSMRLVPGIR